MNNDLMTVSVVIPCKNEEKYIEACVRSIVESNYPTDLISVYVCDGLSSDRSAEIVRSLSEQYSQVHLLVNERQTTPFALNLGIRANESEVVIILGGHAKLHPNYIAQCVHLFQQKSDVGCVGGLLNNIFEDKKSETIAKAMSSSFGVGNAHFRTGNRSGYVDTVAFGAYRREVFQQIGYFDEDLVRNQDDEFNYRVTKAGYKIYLLTDARLDYYVRASFTKLFRQYMQYGYWKVFVNQKHKTVTSVRQLVPLFFVLFALGGAMCSMVCAALWPYYFCIWVLYWTAALYSAGKKATSVRQIPFIVYTFFILHGAYGWGYLKGLVNIVILNKKPQTARLTR